MKEKGDEADKEGGQEEGGKVVEDVTDLVEFRRRTKGRTVEERREDRPDFRQSGRTQRVSAEVATE